jgi:AraC-like DNA-binding protein
MPRIRTLAPAPVLAPFVASLGWYESDGPADGVLETAVPTGLNQLVVNLCEDELRWHAGGAVHRRPGIGISAPADRPVTIDTAEQHRTICVVFRPAGAYPFFGPPVDALDEPVVSLADLWGDDRDLRARLVEAPSPLAALSLLQDELVARAVRPLHPDRGIATAAAALGRGLPVGEVSDRLGTTAGALRRRFAAQVGLTPKRYARVRRLQRLLDSVLVRPGFDWSRAAVESGYFDQAHMVNEFRALTGVTPSAYRPRSSLERNHVPITTVAPSSSSCSTAGASPAAA